MPQATNQPAFDPYSVNSYYDEGFYGNQSYDQSYAVADEGFGYLGHPDQDYHGQGYGGDLWLGQQSTIEIPVECQSNKYSESYDISCNHIPIRKIQNVIFLVNTKVAQLSLDSGCEGDCVHEDECKRLEIKIEPLDSTDTQPTQADGYSPLNVVGKAKFDCVRDNITLHFDGYVVRNLQAPILCGGSFLSRNKITQELHNHSSEPDQGRDPPETCGD